MSDPTQSPDPAPVTTANASPSTPVTPPAPPPAEPAAPKAPRAPRAPKPPAADLRAPRQPWDRPVDRGQFVVVVSALVGLVRAMRDTLPSQLQDEADAVLRAAQEAGL